MSPPERTRGPFAAAILHPLNAVLLGSSALSAALVGSATPLLVGLAAEVGWALVGPRLPSARRVAARAARSDGTTEEQGHLRLAREGDRRRFLALDLLRRELRGAVRDDAALAVHLVDDDLRKLDDLVQAFARIAGHLGRMDAGTEDAATLEDDVRRQRTIAERAPTAEARAAAAARLELMEQRLEQRGRSSRREAELSAQLDRIEQMVQRVRDQALELGAPEGVSAQLEEVERALAAADSTARELEALGAASRARAATRG